MTLISAGFLWFSWLNENIDHHNIHVLHGLVVFLVLAVAAILYKASLKTVEEEIIPEKKFGLKNLMQVTVEGLYQIIKGVIPHHTADYFPLLATLFIYILCCNLMGVFPGVLPPTENISTNLAVALTVFVYYNAVGIRRQGFSNYMAHFFGPSLGKGLGMNLLRFGFLAPLMFVIELISHSVRPVSLSLRLFGNINGDHRVLSTFSDLAPLVVPVIFLAFGIFVAFIQAFVFTLLSSIYVALAVESHDH